MTARPFEPEFCAQLLAALAAPERLRVVRFLAGGPHTVSEIAEMLGAPATNVSHHLAVLKESGLVRADKRGRFVDYSLREGLLLGGDSVTALDLGCCRLMLPTTPAAG